MKPKDFGYGPFLLGLALIGFDFSQNGIGSGWGTFTHPAFILGLVSMALGAVILSGTEWASTIFWRIRNIRGGRVQILAEAHADILAQALASECNDLALRARRSWHPTAHQMRVCFKGKSAVIPFPGGKAIGEHIDVYLEYQVTRPDGDGRSRRRYDLCVIHINQYEAEELQPFRIWTGMRWVEGVGFHLLLEEIPKILAGMYVPSTGTDVVPLGSVRAGEN